MQRRREEVEKQSAMAPGTGLPRPNNPRAAPAGAGEDPSPFGPDIPSGHEGFSDLDSPRKITDIVGRMILDSRGNPTVEVDCWVDDVHLGRAAVPSGASTGTHEAAEIRDGGYKWLGRGVDTAVDNVNGEIQKCLVGMPVDDQRAIDEALIGLDGTLNKSRLGANAILGASLACFKASFESVGRHIIYRTISRDPSLFDPTTIREPPVGTPHISDPSDIVSKYRSNFYRDSPASSRPSQKLPDDELFERLRLWRLNTSRKKRVPAYVVFLNKTLKEIASKRPKNLDSLSKIGHVSKNKLREYGKEIIDIISEAGDSILIPPRLPIPLMNILNGGAHAASNVDIQEFMVVPHGFDTFHEALRAGVETYHALREVLKDEGLLGGVGDEGGFAPNLDSNEDGLRYVVRAIERAGYAPSEQISIALDCASQEFFDGDHYHIDGRELTGSKLGHLYTGWLNEYPIVSIEDPFGEDDWDSWTEFTEREGERVQVVGDDIYVTNPDRLQRGIDDNASNAILIKPNQIGTVSETLNVINMAKLNGFRTVISHRSGETSDDFISDLAFWTNAGQIKTGAPARSDRTSKYNQLLRTSETHNRYTDGLF